MEAVLRTALRKECGGCTRGYGEGWGKGLWGGGWGGGSAVTVTRRRPTSIADLADKLSLALTENDYSNWQKKNCTRTVLEYCRQGFLCLFVCVCVFSLSAFAVVVFVVYCRGSGWGVVFGWIC